MTLAVERKQTHVYCNHIKFHNTLNSIQIKYINVQIKSVSNIITIIYILNYNNLHNLKTPIYIINQLVSLYL